MVIRAQSELADALWRGNKEAVKTTEAEERKAVRARGICGLTRLPNPIGRVHFYFLYFYKYLQKLDPSYVDA
jgi:hypothetical protein